MYTCYNAIMIDLNRAEVEANKAEKKARELLDDSISEYGQEETAAVYEDAIDCWKKVAKLAKLALKYEE
ncbi:MAG: hypothetical protein MN733_06555 [Nitrososphaera sp.]|nr:hypothetical protein [Nitrososphaera sp.]